MMQLGKDPKGDNTLQSSAFSTTITEATDEVMKLKLQISKLEKQLEEVHTIIIGSYLYVHASTNCIKGGQEA